MNASVLFISCAITCLALPNSAWAKSTSSSKKNSPAAASVAPTATATASPIWNFKVREDDSVFAIITRKSGVAARLAHNHFIVARDFDAQLSADSKNPTSGAFSFKTRVTDLEVDRAELQKRWYPTVQSLGWLKEPFEALKDSDRDTIRENMLASGQLNAEKFPEISAKIEKIVDAQEKIGERSFSKKATVALTIRGQTVNRDFPANISLQGEELQVEAAGSLKFTDFGIEPYKALMGALGNDDRFYVLVSFRATKK
ncbi:MAG: YceI family protein [Betaproteobacteria bacterium]|nr:YceI family protein [Betaproteobacteria bacterium]